MPGETFQTLKEKSTQQGLQSGMSQTQAENYGSAMATQSAVQGNANPDFLGANEEQKDKTLNEIISNVGATPNVVPSNLSNFSNAATQNVLSGIADRKAAELAQQGQSGGAGLDALNKYMISIGDLDFSLPFSPLGIIPNTLKGFQATKRFFNNLKTKGVDGLSTEDKIILANLIKAGGLEGGIDFEKYSDELFTSDQMKERFEDAANKLKAGVTVDGETVSYEDLIDQYEDGKPGGVGDLFGLLDVREKGITLEKLKDTLGSEGLAYLQANNPALYFNTFGVPATLAGTEMDDLASMSLAGLTNSPEDKKLAQMIVEARERIAENRQSQNAGQGIVAASPALPGLPFVPPSKPIDITFPIMNEPVPPTGIMSQPLGVAGFGNYPNYFPFLYNNSYTNRGLPSAYSNILSKYYGFA
jgi:hypothetical protein